ncbi:MAG: hypothetical protein H6810_00695 [Phycisphaeraceae bacterium]|nr:MAG: hypothetical protein H6810_00695 [Phycisphaeraceae bacterium]
MHFNAMLGLNIITYLSGVHPAARNPADVNADGLLDPTGVVTFVRFFLGGCTD